VWGFFSPLLPFFAMMVFSGAVIPGTAWCLGRRRRRALRSGRAVRIGCRIRADQPPYPGEYTAGELVAALGGPVHFLPKRGALLELPLGGEVQRSLYAPPSRFNKEVERSAVSYLTPAGVTLLVEVKASDADNVRSVLASVPTRTEPPRRLPLRIPGAWALCATLALLGAVPVAGIAVFGRTVTAQVTTDHDDFCRITWPDPWNGSHRTAHVDCDGEAKGDPVQVVALPRPFQGNAFDTYSLPFLGILCGSLLCASAIGTALPHLLKRRRWRSAEAITAPGSVSLIKPPGDTAGSPPAPTYTWLADAARGQDAQHEDPRIRAFGPDRPDIRRSPWWRVRVVREQVFYNCLSRGGVFTLAVGGATASPHGWGLVGAVIGALGAIRIVWFAVSGVRITRRLLRASRSQEEGHPMRYVRLYGPEDGEPWLILFPADAGDWARPTHSLALMPGHAQPMPPPVGTLSLHGTIEDGGVVVPWTGETVLWPASPLKVLPPGDNDAESFVLTLTGNA
jgi:hypothetical protein